MGTRAREPALRRARQAAGPSPRDRATARRSTFTARHVDLLGADPRAGGTPSRRRRVQSLPPTSLRYRDFLTVALIVDKPDLFPDNWIYIHDPSVKVGRIQNFRSWSPEMVPDPTLACLGLEYFCFEGDGLWTADRRRPDRARQEGARADRPRRPRTTSSTAASCASRRPIRSTTTTTSANVDDDPRRARRRSYPDAAPRRPQRHAQVQQPGPRDDDGDADRQEHRRRRAASTTSGTSTRTPSITRPAKPARARRCSSVRLVPQRVRPAA